MLYVLYALFFVACIVLVVTVLLQPGKTDAGALFTSNVSSSAFGPRGTASILSKMTIVAASVFMISAFMISLPALQGGVSVLQSAPGMPESSAPAAIGSDDNSNTAPEENAAEPEAEKEAPAEQPADEPKPEDNTNASANAAAEEKGEEQP